MHFQIYFPGVRTSDPEHFTRAGLANIADAHEFSDVRKGPDGGIGMLAGWRPGRPEQPVGFYPDRQTWLRVEPEAGRQAYWLGFWNNFPPRPAELQRSGAGVPGQYVAMGDGQQWLIPLAVHLPKSLHFEGGTWETRVQEQYAGFWDEALTWAEYFVTSPPEKLESMVEVTQRMPKWADTVLRALQLNYRMTPEVVNHLHLFSAEAVLMGMRAITAALAIAEIDQKKSPAMAAAAMCGTCAPSPGAVAC